jgi:hypothetical protein
MNHSRYLAGYEHTQNGHLHRQPPTWDNQKLGYNAYNPDAQREAWQVKMIEAVYVELKEIDKHPGGYKPGKENEHSDISRGRSLHPSMNKLHYNAHKPSYRYGYGLKIQQMVTRHEVERGSIVASSEDKIHVETPDLRHRKLGHLR